MRSSSGAKSGESRRVTRSTKARMAFLDAVSFQDDRGSLAARLAVARVGRSSDKIGNAAKADSNARRLTPEKGEFADMVASLCKLRGAAAVPVRLHGWPLCRVIRLDRLLGHFRASTPMPSSCFASRSQSSQVGTRAAPAGENVNSLKRFGEHFLQIISRFAMPTVTCGLNITARRDLLHEGRHVIDRRPVDLAAFFGRATKASAVPFFAV